MTTVDQSVDQHSQAVVKTVTLTIDDVEVTVPEGTLIIRAAEQIGIQIPRFCDHPLLDPVGACRQCLVDVPDAANGRGETRFMETKRTFPKPINISAQVLLDRERCVLCARCTRFSEQIAGDPFIALIERGALQQVGIYEKAHFEPYFSGNAIQICPVGALTSADYRFRSRPFDLVSSPSVAEHDACGSAIRVDHRRGKVMRRLAGNDPEVNEEWISDKDRFAFRYAQVADRITYPQVRETLPN